MAKVANACNLGMLIIDEIQNLNAAASGGHESMLNFFVTLRNEIGIPVVLVGTMRAYPILQSEFSQARRGSGYGSILWFGASQLGAITDYIDPRPDSMDPIANSRKLLEIIKYEKPKYIVAIDMCYLGMIKPIENELKELGINDVVILHASDSMDELGMQSYLTDVVNYEKLKTGNIEIYEDIPAEVLYGVAEKLKGTMEQQNNLLIEAVKTSPLRIHNYVDLAKECQNSKLEVISDPELVNYIGHTSGTSGARPKPITLTNRNANSSVIQEHNFAH